MIIVLSDDIYEYTCTITDYYSRVGIYYRSIVLQLKKVYTFLNYE